MSSHNNSAHMGTSPSTVDAGGPARSQTADGDCLDISALAERLKAQVQDDLEDETLSVLELANCMAAQQHKLMAHAAKLLSSLRETASTEPPDSMGNNLPNWVLKKPDVKFGLQMLLMLHDQIYEACAPGCIALAKTTKDKDAGDAMKVMVETMFLATKANIAVLAASWGIELDVQEQLTNDWGVEV